MRISDLRARRLAVAAACLALFGCGGGSAGSAGGTPPDASTPPAPLLKPWLDAGYSADERAAMALKEMTQDEKLQYVSGYFGADLPSKGTTRNPAAIPASAGYVPGVPRLDLPALFETDAGIGVASQPTPTPRERTALPSGLAVAASWDPALAYGAGAMIGSEARASGFNVMLAGGVNLARDPRNGRNFEYAGEDPLLAGVIVGQSVKGIQSNDIISTLKHYAFNDQESGRMQLDARIDNVVARMSDLLAMQIVLEQGDPGAVMCAYNKVNAVYACENAWLLNEVLKQDWAYPGFVMSDWGAVHSTVAAANNGLDQESGREFDSQVYFGTPLKAAVAAGSVSQARLDDMVRRILRSMFAKGLVDHPVAQGGAIDFAAHNLVSRGAAEAGMVLLKNAGQALPLPTALKTIAVIGGHADVGVLSGSGSSQVYPVGGAGFRINSPWPGPVIYDPSSPLKAIQALAPGAQVVFDDGTDATRAATLAASADAVVVFATQWVGEDHDAASLALDGNQDALIGAVARANARTVVVLETGGPVTMPWLGSAAAVLQAWYPGTSGGDAIARVLFGVVNPSGRLPITYPVSEAQLPRPVLSNGPVVDYQEGAAVGYKWFDAQGLTPLFPFGYGLSYTRFGYSALAAQWKDGKLQVSFTVTNNGAVSGQDVPQLYVSPPTAQWEAPKRLAGWSKLELAPGASGQLTLTLEPRTLALFDGASKTWRVAAGTYRVTLAHDAGESMPFGVDIDLPALTLDMRGEPVH
jgi:beta-glucosidase